ncbi:MAG TPA: hypothetical protein VJ351_17205 [Streptosporangiaceae bacterium]|jgi:hypothetical protein|nr:hypothetical protein [Streptosporangiaceae bacterium]
MNIRWVQGLAEDLPAVPGSQTRQPDRATRPGSQTGNLCASAGHLTRIG